MNPTKIDLTKEKIKKAAKNLMAQCENPTQVTSRAIAKEAGVQPAMINYCFGSREALLFSLFQDLSSEQFREYPQLHEILQSNRTPKEKLIEIHYIMVTMMLENYVYMQAIIAHVLLHRDLSQGLNSLPFVIEHYAGRKTEAECKLISYELSGIMQLVVYRHEELKAFCSLNLMDARQRKQFVKNQIDLFLQD